MLFRDLWGIGRSLGTDSSLDATKEKCTIGSGKNVSLTYRQTMSNERKDIPFRLTNH